MGDKTKCLESHTSRLSLFENPKRQLQKKKLRRLHSQLERAQPMSASFHCAYSTPSPTPQTHSGESLRSVQNNSEQQHPTRRKTGRTTAPKMDRSSDGCSRTKNCYRLMSQSRIFAVALTVGSVLIAARSVHSFALQPSSSSSSLSTSDSGSASSSLSNTNAQLPATSTFSTPNSKKKDCYKTILHDCGRRFINSYKFVAVENNPNEDILTSQCALRTAFFTCLNHQTRDCKSLHRHRNSSSSSSSLSATLDPASYIAHNEASHSALSHRDAEYDFDPEEREARLQAKVDHFRLHRKKRDRQFRKRLSNTIWDSRICIYRGSVHTAHSNTDSPLI